MNDPNLYYGLSGAVLACSSTFSSIVISYYCDMSKRTRLPNLTASCIVFIGSILYTIYYSPVIVLVGQFFIGFYSMRMVVSTAEISRIYKKDDFMKIRNDDILSGVNRQDQREFVPGCTHEEFSRQ